MTSAELLARLREANITVPPSGVLTAAQAAQVLGRHPRTLEEWRTSGTGPQAMKLGGRWHYDVNELAAFIAKAKKPHTNTQNPTGTHLQHNGVTGETAQARKSRSSSR
jgi:hypothetical protein